MKSGIDIAIVGSGPVGATLAAMLSGSGYHVRVLEARAAPSRDARTLALSHASRELLGENGAWPGASATPIASIHISQQGGPGRALLTAGEQGLPALGYTVAYAALEETLEARLGAAGVSLAFGAACEAIELARDGVTLRLGTGEEVRTRLLVLADGGTNARHIPGIAYEEKDYGQVALTAAVRTDRAHGSRAYERFTPRGPVALLPVADRYALVWTATPVEAARLIALPEKEFLAELQAYFGDRAGAFVAAGRRASFPLRLRTVNTPVALRTVLVGNAAQALHPIAGQGLNIGLRDAATLAALIADGSQADPGDARRLELYRAARGRDTRRGVAFTDFLVSAFADGRRLPTWGRGLALTMLDLFPPARRLLAERMIRGAGAA